MLYKHRILRALFGKYFGSAAVAAALLLAGHVVWAREGAADRAIMLIESIPVPVSADNNTAGGLYSFDISWVDQTTHTYYLADRSNNRVDIVDVISPRVPLKKSGAN